MERRTYWFVAVVAVVVIAAAVWFKYVRGSGYQFDESQEIGLSSVVSAGHGPRPQ